MVKVRINGIPIDLPYEPYPSQLVTISKLVEAFQTNSHCLIESPTGTGKSLSIICSVLGYLQSQSEKPQIFICSRTHKQLDQLIEQLRKTSYNPRITILGSRNQYCINSKLKDTPDKNKGCQELLKSKNCNYFNGKEKLMKKMSDKLFDIEELKVEGKKCTGCPYFASRLLQTEGEVIFAPYNYLIETSIRESCDLKLENSIVLIDEAHNIEDCCRTAGSTEISSKLLEIIVNEVTSCIKKSALLGDMNMEFRNLLEIFRKMREHSVKETSKIIKGKDIIKEVESMGITKERFLVYKNALSNIKRNEDAKSLLDLNIGRVLEEIERILGMILFTGCEAYAYSFTKLKDSFSYNFLLLDPSLMFLPLTKVKSLSLLSGTLTPFSALGSELKFNFQHKVIAPHVLRDEQIFASVIKKGHLKRDLCGTYSIVETAEYLDQIVKIIRSIAEETRTSGGTLVFVPSYTFLSKIESKLDCVAETKDNFEKKMEEYKKRIKLQKTSIFLCVYRGKASEGIDFRDEHARAVIAIGIPFPSIKDPQISLKKEYNDKNGSYNGRLWYEAQAFRAVNQALGRAIRHSNDWGSVFLLDSRYATENVKRQLPTWIHKNLKINEDFSSVIGDYKSFLKINGSSIKK